MTTVWEATKSRLFTNDYKVVQQIGAGGSSGKVYQCNHQISKNKFAVKVISKAKLYHTNVTEHTKQEMIKHMKNEINILKKLNHKYLINYKEYYEDKNAVYIVMEHCKGGELYDRIKQKKRYKEKEAAPIIKMILEGLFYLHKYHKIVHGDIKPENILFANKTENSLIKIIDFGHSFSTKNGASKNKMHGSYYYMAPEAFNGEHTYATDMWSIGVILFAMIFGFQPFHVNQSKYKSIPNGKTLMRETICKLIENGFDATAKPGYGPWFPADKHMHVSDQVKDLITQLLQYDCSKRLTAKEVLQHEWIKNGGKIMKHIETKLLTKEIMYEFAHFVKANEFSTHIITPIFRKKFEKLRPNHFDSIKKIFEMLDENKYGFIDYKQFEINILKQKHLNLEPHNIGQIFNSLDINKSGIINFECFVKPAIHYYIACSAERLYVSFCDLDDEIDKKENELKIYKYKLKLKIEQMGIVTRRNRNKLFGIIDCVDLNNDNYIGYDKYLYALHCDLYELPDWFWNNVYESTLDKDYVFDETNKLLKGTVQFFKRFI
eukprot:278825_1